MLGGSKPSRREFLGAGSAGVLTAGRRAFGEAPVREYRRGGMVYRPLGQTGIDVSLLAFGSHTNPADRLPAGPNKTVLTAAGQARRDRMIAHAFDLGVNFLDVYDNEGQWAPAARLIRERRNKILVSLAHSTTAQEIDRAARLFGHIDLHRFLLVNLDSKALERWDTLRRAKEAGKIRAIGIACHSERSMTTALDQLDGLDFIMFPYNFIYARADYSQFLPAALSQGVGLIAMKPLAAGSIMKLDARARPGAKPEDDSIKLWDRQNKPILPAAVAELTKSLDRMPDETLCMAAMRFVYSRPFLGSVIAGMFEDRLLEDNYKALARSYELLPNAQAALDAARRVAELRGTNWLPAQYRWLEEEWRA